MRMYGKRFMRNTRNSALEMHRETRDGIIWAIDKTNRTVDVRIQGTNKAIKAYFPDNWYEPPPWCKLGNAIKITHTGGNRGRIEIVGNGLVIPYPQTGALWPSDPVQENMVITGLQVLAMPNLPGNKVLVTPGTARIEGVEVEVDCMTMDDGDEYQIGDGGYLDNIAAVLNAGTAVGAMVYPDWGYRINSVQLDQSGNLSVVSGDLFEAYNSGYIYKPGPPPVYIYSLDSLPWPNVPWGSLQIGYIVRYENQTVIKDHDINFNFWNTSPWLRYSRIPTRLDISIVLPVMAWTDTTTAITVTCYDNLEQYMYMEDISLEASIIDGNGDLKDLTYDTGYDTTITARQYKDGAVWKPYWHLEYKRDGLVTDVSPTIQFKMLINNEISTYAAIELLDAGGNPMH